MNFESPLEPLARAVHALELAGLALGDVPAETLEAAEQGKSFALSFDLPGQTRLELQFDPEAAQYEVAVHLVGGYAREEVVLAALQLNHEMPSRSRRFSLEAYSGDVVLSDVLHWNDAAADELALCVCDLMLQMGELEELQPLEQLQETAAPVVDTPLGAVLRG